MTDQPITPARQKAITAMFDADTNSVCSLELAARMLDNIPPNILARLAIETGGLQPVATHIRTPEMPGLYRLVDDQ